MDLLGLEPLLDSVLEESEAVVALTSDSESSLESVSVSSSLVISSRDLVMSSSLVSSSSVADSSEDDSSVSFLCLSFLSLFSLVKTVDGGMANGFPFCRIPNRSKPNEKRRHTLEAKWEKNVQAR